MTKTTTFNGLCYDRYISWLIRGKQIVVESEMGQVQKYIGQKVLKN